MTNDQETGSHANDSDAVRSTIPTEGVGYPSGSGDSEQQHREDGYGHGGGKLKQQAEHAAIITPPASNGSAASINQMSSRRTTMQKTVLFVWECGAGMGHLVQIRPVAQELRRRGNRVFVAARDVARAAPLFEGSGIVLFPAPFKLGRPIDGPAVPCSVAHILHNVGWDNAAGLGGLVDAWRAIYELVKPDVIVCEHSPTALLAARGFNARRVIMGTGFFCPPDQSPLPNLRPWEAVDPAKLSADEAAVLRRANDVLAQRRRPQLQRLGQLFSQVDGTLLTTFKELDHYVNRAGDARYFGCPTDLPGKAPQWPAGSGKRIIAYLKPFPALPHLLTRLKGMGCPTIIICDGIDASLRHQFTCGTMHFETGRLDMQSMVQTCDAAVLNANHATAAAMLLAGKPLLLLPIFLEQQILAERIVGLGVAVSAASERAKEVVSGLEQLVGNKMLGAYAAGFGKRHDDFDAARKTEEMASLIEG
jgi:hypothetical protein